MNMLYHRLLSLSGLSGVLWLAFALAFLPSILVAEPNLPSSAFGGYNDTLRAARAGSVQAQNRLGTMLVIGHEAPRNSSAAAAWFEVAALRGFPEAQLNLGMLYLTGDGVKEDVLRAARFIKDAADNGYPKAQNLLGYFYEQGVGVRANRDEAVKWYNKASVNGNSEAKNNLIRIGLPVPPTEEPPPAEEKSKLPAGNIPQPETGNRPVVKGVAPPRDLKRSKPSPPKSRPAVPRQKAPTPYTPLAPSYMQQKAAAAGGNVEAQNWLGTALASQVKSTTDLVATAGWFYAAAKQGHPQSQIDLGMMYLVGLGVKENPAQAAHYFTLAAQENHPEAQMLLARLYLWGTGVEKNPAAALKWYTLAESLGHKSATKERTQLLSTLAPPELAWASREVQSFRIKWAKKVEARAKAKAEAIRVAKKKKADAIIAAKERKAAAIRVAKKKKADAIIAAKERRAAAILLAKKQKADAIIAAKERRAAAILLAKKQKAAAILLAKKQKAAAIQRSKKKTEYMRLQAQKKVERDKSILAAIAVREKANAEVAAKHEIKARAEALRSAKKRAEKFRQQAKKRLEKEQKILAAIEVREDAAAKAWIESDKKAEEWAKVELARQEKILAAIEKREIAEANALEQMEKDSIGSVEQQSQIPQLKPMPRRGFQPIARTTHQPKARVRKGAITKTTRLPRAKTKHLDAAIAKAHGFIPNASKNIVLARGEPTSMRRRVGGDGGVVNSFIYDGSHGAAAGIVAKPGTPISNMEPDAVVADSTSDNNMPDLFNGKSPTPRKRVGPLLHPPAFSAVPIAASKKSDGEAVLGKAALRGNDFTKALVHFRASYQLDPNNLDHIHNTASLTLAAKENQKALPLFIKAARLAAVAGRSSDAALYNYQISQILDKKPEWIDKKLVEVEAIPQDKSNVVGVLSNLLELAINHAEVGKLSQAINFGKQALGLAQENLGKNHAVSIMAERQLGEIIMQQGDVVGAKSLFTQAVQHSTASLGATHTETLAVYTLLATLHEQQMELSKAAKILVSVQRSYNEGLGPDHPISLRNSLSLARIYLNMGQSKKSEALLRKSCISYAKTFGFQHTDTAACVMQYASAAFSQGAFPIAIANYQLATEIFSGSLPEGSPALLESQTGLAKAYHQQGRIKEARRLIEMVIRLGEARPDDNAQLLNKAHLTHARLLMDAGKSTESKESGGRKKK
jgi:TPR repeat protein/tetratricopeptide (TPR) repeat protein